MERYSMNIPVVGIGAGGNAKVVIEILRFSGRYNLHGLLDTSSRLRGESVLGVPVLGADDLLKELAAEGVRNFFVGIGATTTLEPRRRLYELACSHGMAPVDAIHPAAIISPSALYVRGLTAMANTVINANAILGENVLVNTGAIVEHDSIIGNHIHISPRAVILAAAEIGDCTMIGAGAVIKQGVRIGSHALIGAGAVVIEDVLDGETVVGIPARPMKRVGAR
jgi:sugar O-acyltransferase (sialic acid O-acetyltransferase NeuD family)